MVKVKLNVCYVFVSGGLWGPPCQPVLVEKISAKGKEEQKPVTTIALDRVCVLA